MGVPSFITAIRSQESASEMLLVAMMMAVFWRRLARARQSTLREYGSMLLVGSCMSSTSGRYRRSG